MEIEVSEDGFVNAIMAINGGALIDELDREMIKSVQAIFDNGGKADITLKLSLSRIANMESAVNIKHDVTVKLPKEERPNKAMFVTHGSGLTDQYQQQDKLPLGEETPRRGPTLASIDKSTGEIKA